MMKFNGWATVLMVASLAACSANQTESAAKGAATGAVSASLVGALTDLVVDGQVNTDRLERNLVSGAIAGGAAGAVVGNEKDKQEQAAAEQGKNDSSAQPGSTQVDTEEAKLREKIGDDNYQGLGYLMQCQHADAYRQALKGSSGGPYQEASIALQALVDRDRKNTDGEKRAIEQFVAIAEPESSAEQIQTELDKLEEQLQQERQIQGLSPDCPAN